MKNFSIIVAMDEDRGIGRSGLLAWHLPTDLKRFKEVTCAVRDRARRNAVLMGRHTWVSLPEKVRPLPGRLNVVLTRQKNLPTPEGVLCFGSMDHALTHLTQREDIEQIYVIGGAKLFAVAVLHPLCQQILLTQVIGRYSCDTFFPLIPARFKSTFTGPLLSELGCFFQFLVYQS